MKKTFIILFTSIICLAAGTAVAYYNTSSFGYDDTNMFSLDKGSVSIMDIDIDYGRFIQMIDKVIEKIYYKPITI